jgi:hypothetical protein
MKIKSAIEENKKITQAYLEEAGIDLTLTRIVKQKTSTGGFTPVPSTLPVQRFAIIGPQAGLRRAPEVPTNVGEIASYNLTLLGHYDADVKDNDTFELKGGRYRVDFVFPDDYRDRYETVAVVVYEGSLDILADPPAPPPEDP